MARKTKAEAAATREALLDAAEAVFLENGVARTSLEQIARHAGMTRGAVYWHFKNKADLFRAMLERVRMPFQELIDEIGDPELANTPLEAIRLACHRGLLRLEQPRYRRVHAILIHHCEIFSDIDPLAMQNEIANDCGDALQEYFANAATRGQLRADISPALATSMMQACLGGLFHDWLRNHERFSLHERGTEIVDALLGLLGTPPPRAN